MDYPYVRFNTRLDKLDYTNEEYGRYIAPLTMQLKSGQDLGLHLSSTTSNTTRLSRQEDLEAMAAIPFSRQEDDELAHLAHLYDLRWPVRISLSSLIRPLTYLSSIFAY